MTPAFVAPVFENLDWPGNRWFRSNILIDSFGHPAGIDGTSRTLTRGRDRALLRLLRQDAEVIVTGGSTVRAEGWHFPPDGILLVVSHGDLPLATCPYPERLRLVTPDSPNESVVATLGETIAALNATRVLCESGPRLLRMLTDSIAIDEAFVSVVRPLTAETSEEHARQHLDLRPSDYRLIDSVSDSDIAYLRFLRGESSST